MHLEFREKENKKTEHLKALNFADITESIHLVKLF